MKTSHEMAQSVLKKRDRILRRRRILTASIGTAAGITAVAAALAVSPRGQLRCAAAVSTPAPIRQNRIQQATTPRRIT